MIKGKVVKKRVRYLENPTRDEIYNQEPLLLFSYYLSDKNNLLLATSDEILDNLNRGFTPIKGVIHTKAIGEASSMMWFWTLGAYEVVRTMCQAKECFSKELMDDLLKLKKALAEIRMPSSKMEMKGKSIPISSNRSPDGWDFENKDLFSR